MQSRCNRCELQHPVEEIEGAPRSDGPALMLIGLVEKAVWEQELGEGLKCCE